VRVGDFNFSPGWVPTLATLVLLPILILLGVWQLGRAAEKQSMRADFERRITAAPVALDPANWRSTTRAKDSRRLGYTRVVFSGFFSGERQYLLDNRVHNGVAGFEVLTPFDLEDGDLQVLINRGWIPLPDRRDRLPELSTPRGRVKIGGMIDLEREALPLLGASGYEQTDWPKIVQRVELEQMASQLGSPLVPIVVLLDKEVPGGFVREWKAHYGFPPSRHHGYALQWFSLAVALLVLYVVVNLERVDDGQE
jgi:surfeit locus 1 family protein